MATELHIKVTLPGLRPPDAPIPQRKLDYAKKLKSCLEEYDTCLMITVDNVGARQIQSLRKEYRNRCRFLFGKNVRLLHISPRYKPSRAPN